MRKLLLAVFLFLPVLFTTAQTTFTNTTSEAVERVIRDYRNHFKNIRGEQLSQNAVATGYKSIINVPGTNNCSITIYNNNQADACSWQAVVIETNDFAAARIKYKEVFDQVKNTIVRVDGQRPAIINGKFDVPTEDKKWNNISFELIPVGSEFQKLQVGLSIQKTSQKWMVVLKVHDTTVNEEGYAIDSK